MPIEAPPQQVFLRKIESLQLSAEEIDRLVRTKRIPLQSVLPGLEEGQAAHEIEIYSEFRRKLQRDRDREYGPLQEAINHHLSLIGSLRSDAMMLASDKARPSYRCRSLKAIYFIGGLIFASLCAYSGQVYALLRATVP